MNLRELFNAFAELSNDGPIKVVDEKSARDRIIQWQKQGLQYEKFVIAAESFNLLHLVSLVQIYDDLQRLGEKLHIKNVKSWVIMFMKRVLNINSKAEQEIKWVVIDYENYLTKELRVRNLHRLGVARPIFSLNKNIMIYFCLKFPDLKLIDQNFLLKSQIKILLHQKKSCLEEESENEIPMEFAGIYRKLR